MDDVSQSILDAWDKLWPKLKEDRDELRRRLARRRSPSLQRPMRHQCIAVRASDRRITPMHWVITPSHAMDLDHPAHPYERIEHEVLIQTFALRKFCRPVQVDDWGEDVADVAKQLGCGHDGLKVARRSLVHRMISGLGGKKGPPVPIIHNRRPFDPGSRKSFAPPDPILGGLWRYLPDSLPEGFEQAVMRVPIFGNLRRGAATVPGDHRYKDDEQFKAWRWICPGCKKRVATIYYPIRVWNLCDFISFDPAKTAYIRGEGDGGVEIGGRHPHRAEARFRAPASGCYDVWEPPATFACRECHRVLFFSDCSGRGWNDLVSHLTAGLMYGSEVGPPDWYKPGENRKRRRTRMMSARAKKREAVVRRLCNGWSNFQIAKDLGISIISVIGHLRIACEQEGAADRHELAAKLGAVKSPPLNQVERAGKRRLQVKELLLAGCSYREIMERLGMDHFLVSKDAQAIYRLYGVSGHGLKARRALAEKLGVELGPSKGARTKARIAELRGRGMKWLEIAREMGLHPVTVLVYARGMREGVKVEG